MDIGALARTAVRAESSAQGRRARGYLEACRDRVFLHIRRYLEARTAALPRGLRACLVEYPYRRGKAVRPAFIMLFNDAFGGERRRAFKVAATYQLLEDWGLGRDDILDSALLRRGKPALHRLYGLPAALNALDLLHACVGDMLYEYCALPQRLHRRLHRAFMDATAVTLSGQHLDLQTRGIPLERFTAERYFAVVGMKTAHYTGACPCRIGAILAGAGARAERDAAEFGRRLGLAFQVLDDVLDVENTGVGRFGKAPGNDLYEGKRTLVLVETLRRCSSAQRRGILAVYRKPIGSRTRADADFVRTAARESGALARCRETVRERTDDAVRFFRRRLAPRMPASDARRIAEFAELLASRSH